MKIKLICLRLLGTVLLSMSFTAQAALTDEITHALNQHLSDTHIGILVRELGSGKVLYRLNDGQAFVPASTLKLFTAAAALYYLGANYQFTTSVFLLPDTRFGKTIKGNLWIRFQGDPTLTVSELKGLIEQLHQKGIETIEGNIILDTSFFSGQEYAPGWVQDSLNWSYSAPVSAVMLDENWVEVKLTPGKTIGDLAEVESLTPFVPVKGEVETVSQEEAAHHCSLAIRVTSSNEVELGGCWPQGKTPSVLNIALQNPLLYAERVIQQSLEEQKITLQGSIRHGQWQGPDQPLVEHRSSQLRYIIDEMLLHSNNLYAEALLKTLGQHYTKRGSFQEGVNSLKDILHQKAQMDFTSAELFDGSGLSRYNLVTPRQMDQLLSAIFSSPQLKPLFLEALPVGGKTGTLANWMKGVHLVNHVNAKTGSMLHISSLSGYLKTKRQHWVSFVIFIDQAVKDTKQLRAAEQQLVELFYQYG